MRLLPPFEKENLYWQEKKIRNYEHFSKISETNRILAYVVKFIYSEKATKFCNLTGTT